MGDDRRNRSNVVEDDSDSKKTIKGGRGEVDGLVGRRGTLSLKKGNLGGKRRRKHTPYTQRWELGQAVKEAMTPQEGKKGRPRGTVKVKKRKRGEGSSGN